MLNDTPEDSHTEANEVEIQPGLLRWAREDVGKPRFLDGPEKLLLEKLNIERAEKAESRQSMCWWCGNQPAVRWVHHVGFDLKDDDAVLGHHAIITSDDYPGPVPGFCHHCEDEGPKNLALVVYMDTPAVHFGARARRWYVQFTDSGQKGGLIQVQPPAPIAS